MNLAEPSHSAEVVALSNKGHSRRERVVFGFIQDKLDLYGVLKESPHSLWVDFTSQHQATVRFMSDLLVYLKVVPKTTFTLSISVSANHTMPHLNTGSGRSSYMSLEDCAMAYDIMIRNPATDRIIQAIKDTQLGYWFSLMDVREKERAPVIEAVANVVAAEYSVRSPAQRSVIESMAKVYVCDGPDGDWIRNPELIQERTLKALRHGHKGLVNWNYPCIKFGAEAQVIARRVMDELGIHWDNTKSRWSNT